MPIEDLVHVGVALIGDQSGVAIKARWTVYVGSVDVADGDVELGDGELTVGQAADEALREGVAWLEVQAATRAATPPSLPPVDLPPEVSAPPTRQPRRSQPRRSQREQDPTGGVLATASLDVPAVVDPAGGDGPHDAVSTAQDAPSDAPGQRRKPVRRVGEAVPKSRRRPRDAVDDVQRRGLERAHEDPPPLARQAPSGVEAEAAGDL